MEELWIPLAGLWKLNETGEEKEMTALIIHGTYPSSNGTDQVAYTVYQPEGEIRAILQIAHGMAEHFGRYKDFALFLAERGILVCGNDHLGHGETAKSEEDLGYFAKDKGWIHMVDDMARLTELVKKGNETKPTFLLGHSMGSLLSRAYLPIYGMQLSGAILMGTSGKNPLAQAAIPIVNAMGVLKGERYRSRLIYGLAFGGYTKRYEKGSDRLGWMSQDSAVLSDFRNDPKCNFILTVSGFRDLMQVLQFVSRKEWAKEVPPNLPIHLVSGRMDPVGDYGKGVEQVYEALREAKVDSLSMKFYEEDRHEVLNEPNKALVYQELLEWIQEHL